MEKETLAALNKSILTWKKRVKGTYDGPGGTSGCALCHMFHASENLKLPESKCCHDCPVYQKTKRRFCKRTPYISYIDNGDQKSRVRMLKFLEGLRPNVN